MRKEVKESSEVLKEIKEAMEQMKRTKEEIIKARKELKTPEDRMTKEQRIWRKQQLK